MYQDRKTAEGWEKERRRPLPAGVHELVPWLKQWHNEPSSEYGNERLGDYLACFVDDEARALGVTTADLAAWRPLTLRPGPGSRKKGRCGLCVRRAYRNRGQSQPDPSAGRHCATLRPPCRSIG